MSPSTRSAWVEIFWRFADFSRPGVALYAEGVGRNFQSPVLRPRSFGRPLREGVGRNSRLGSGLLLPAGRPLREGVGRNQLRQKLGDDIVGRPLRGGRG